MATPIHYDEKLPRVSSIVESEFPFEGETEDRFKRWLDSKNVSLSAYMEEACDGGTYVHQSLERFMAGLKTTKKEAKKWKHIDGMVEAGKQFIADYNVQPVSIEHYIRSKFFQGTIDLIADITLPTSVVQFEASDSESQENVSVSETFILDWKTYGLAKTRWGLQAKAYKKPYDKLKKARLQLSLYSYATGINNLAIVELTENGYYFHRIKRMTDTEIERVLYKFILSTL